MAGRRRSKGQDRVEPSFGGGRGDLRLTPDDRPSGAAAPKRRRGASKRPKGRSGGTRRRRGILGFFVRAGLMLGLLATIGLGGVIAYHASQLPPIDELTIPQRPPSISIASSSGSVFAVRGAMGERVLLEDLPKHLPQAVLAIEDRRFYSHFGVDPIGLVRAAAENLFAGNVVQGGSTITQQLAKNLFLTPERTLSRKIQELILSIWLEREFSKDRILETYLNRAYLGAGAHGVEAAAQRYFGKSARHVTLTESAILAGLLKAPSRYAPTRDKEAAMARASVVLDQMAAAGFISEMDAKVAMSEPIRVASSGRESSANYAADWVMDLVPGYVGEIKEDLVVETTLDLYLQDAAQHAMVTTLNAEGKALNASQGAVVAVDTMGAVRALVGGKSYADSQFNRAVEAKRQPGSAFKPFVYLTALERGMTPQSVIRDAPLSVGGWSPENFDKKYRGPVTLANALALSLNTVAARLAVELGPEAVVQTAHRLGISSALARNASIALGTSETSLLELVTAYAPFANGGEGVIPHIITEIRTRDGNVLYERRVSRLGQVVAPQHVGMMNAMLMDTLTRGTGKRAQLPGWQAAGKTGTSQNFRDALFVGYTANLVAGIWLGNDDGTPMKRATGGSAPAAIWSTFMKDAHRGVPVAELPLPRGGPVYADAQPNFGAPQQRHQQAERPRIPGEGIVRDVGGFMKRLFGG